MNLTQILMKIRNDEPLCHICFGKQNHFDSLFYHTKQCQRNYTIYFFLRFFLLQLLLWIVILYETSYDTIQSCVYFFLVSLGFQIVVNLCKKNWRLNNYTEPNDIFLCVMLMTIFFFVLYAHLFH